MKQNRNPSRRVVACRRQPYFDVAGNRQVQFDVEWSDGTRRQYASKKELPREVRLYRSGYRVGAGRRRRALFDLGWDHQPESLTLNWPTYHWLRPISAIALLGLAFASLLLAIQILTDKSIDYWPLIGGLSALVFPVATAALVFVRSNLRLDAKTVTLTKNYGGFMSTESWARTDVKKSFMRITESESDHGKSYHVDFQLRVYTAEGIVWKRIGGNFNSTAAAYLVDELKRFIDIEMA